MNVCGRSHSSCLWCNEGNVNVRANLDGISLHANNWILFQCTCSRSKLQSHRPCVKSMNCLIPVLKSEFSLTVPILDTSGMALKDPALLYFAVGKGIKTFICFHTPEKSDYVHHHQYPYLQGLFFFLSVLSSVLSLIEKLRIRAIVIKLSVACSIWAH